MPFSYIHNPRYKLWSALLDCGETRLHVNVNFSRSSDNPVVQKALQDYCLELDRWLYSLLDELGVPNAAISQIVASLGSVGLSLLELESLTSQNSSYSSADWREVD